MAKVNKVVMQRLIDAGVFPPRHQRGCPKNYARTLPLILAARGKTVTEIKEGTQREYENLPCACK
ncbi:hypothetical protein LCGC14_0915660 [marine sediment metagenome]|uniref:Uncharacterized protein n=1 Tax=marine sediment metagenome TaxID=412755 RepID=A0A0F9NX21_9ZZZZ